MPSTAIANRPDVGRRRAGTPHRKVVGEREVPVRKLTPIAPEYNSSLTAFVKRLVKHQARGAKARGDTRVTNVGASVLPGRKFDRIELAFTYSGEAVPKTEIRYFVNRATGEIYGAKSQLAPNANHFFGTVFNADKWDWSAHYGANVSDESVVEVGSYGHFKHYAPANRFPGIAKKG